DRGLRMCNPGDLLLVFGDSIERSWNQIVDFDASHVGELIPSSPATMDTDLPGVDLVPQVAIPRSDELIRDDRGVRLARPVELED
ncbi:MAG: hypothetical protein ACI8Q9_001013, partial [Planctomycetota bacterium]